MNKPSKKLLDITLDITGERELEEFPSLLKLYTYALDMEIEIERLKEDNEYLNKVNIELSAEKNRLNNIINEYVEDMEDYLDSNPPVDMQDYTHTVSDLEFLEEGIEELKFITTIRAKLQKLKGTNNSEIHN